MRDAAVRLHWSSFIIKTITMYKTTHTNGRTNGQVVHRIRIRINLFMFSSTTVCAIFWFYVILTFLYIWTRLSIILLWYNLFRNITSNNLWCHLLFTIDNCFVSFWGAFEFNISLFLRSS